VCVVRRYVGVALELAVLFRLMRVQIIQHNMDFPVRMFGGDLIHEVQKLAPASTRVVPGLHLSGGDLERGEQPSDAVTLIAVAEAVYRFAIGQPQPPWPDAVAGVLVQPTGPK
jgi:hypothetical protein